MSTFFAYITPSILGLFLDFLGFDKIFLSFDRIFPFRGSGHRQTFHRQTDMNRGRVVGLSHLQDTQASLSAPIPNN